MNNVSRLLAAALLAAAAGAFALGDYPLGVLDNILTSAIIAVGLVLLTGIIGMVSLGQAAFAGLGAYAGAYAAINWGLNPWATLPIALLAAAIPAWIIGALTLRMSAQFLVLATLAWGISFFYLAGALPMFGGQNGLSGIPPLTIGPLPLATSRAIYPVILAGLAASIWMSLNLLDSNLGRMIRTIRYGAAIGESSGANIFALRLTIFTLAATSYAAASLVLRGQSNATPTTSTRAPHGLRTAAGLLRTQPMVRDLFFLIIGIETFLFSPFAVLPTFTHEVLGGGSESLGLLTACASAGGVIVLTGLRRIAGTRYRRLLLGSFVVGPLALLGQSAGATLITASVMLLVLGAALACIDVASQALMQLLGPDDQRGALGGLWVVAVGSAPLGQVGSGLVASALGARAAVAVFGGVALALGFAARRMPLFGLLRSDEPPSPSRRP